jgi:hypothetical protein
MSRIRTGGYGHNWKHVGGDYYRLHWSFDTKIKGSRLRWPRSMERDTDFDGAVRFSLKWDLVPPTKPEPPK